MAEMTKALLELSLAGQRINADATRDAIAGIDGIAPISNEIVPLMQINLDTTIAIIEILEKAVAH